MQARQAYNNSDLDYLDSQKRAVAQIKRQQSDDIAQSINVSVSRDGPTLRPRCSLGPSITRPIPWSILRLRPLAAGVTCRCTAPGNHRVVGVIGRLLIVVLVRFGTAGPIHISGLRAHCMWKRLKNGESKLSIVKLSDNVWSRVEVLVLSYTKWRRWHTWPEYWHWLHCEHILMQYTKGPLDELSY